MVSRLLLKFFSDPVTLGSGPSQVDLSFFHL